MEAGLQKKVAFAKEHILSEQDYENISTEQLRMRAIEKDREFTNEEVDHFLSFLEKIENATVIVSTIPEARRVMELLNFKPDQVTHVLAHENAHANKAEELGGEHLGYEFILNRGSEGNILIHAQAKNKIPDGLSEEEEKIFKLKTLFAPEEYGNKLSEADIRDIEELSKK